MISFERNDGGREGSGILERNDCTVRAFTLVSGIDYKVVRKVFENYGRKNRRSFAFRPHKNFIANELGIILRPVKRSGSLNKLIELYPTSKLIVAVRGHAFAVINGTVKDRQEQSGNRHVRAAWLVEEKRT